MARQAARHSFLVTPPCEGVAPLGAPSQRRYGAGPRFLTFRFALPPARKTPAPFGWPRSQSLGQASRPAVNELLAGGRSAPGRNPGAARVQEERSSPARGRRILLHHQDASSSLLKNPSP